MAGKIDKYIVNPQTLVAEIEETPRGGWWKLLLVVFSSLLLFVFYLWIYVSVLGLVLQK